MSPAASARLAILPQTDPRLIDVPAIPIGHSATSNRSSATQMVVASLIEFAQGVVEIADIAGGLGTFRSHHPDDHWPPGNPGSAPGQGRERSRSASTTPAPRWSMASTSSSACCQPGPGPARNVQAPDHSVQEYADWNRCCRAAAPRRDGTQTHSGADHPGPP